LTGGAGGEQSFEMISHLTLSFFVEFADRATASESSYFAVIPNGSIIWVEVTSLKTVKVSLTLPEDLLRQIKSMTDNVSAFVTEGIRQHVARERLKMALEFSDGAWNEENHPNLNTLEDVEKYVDSIRSSWRQS
jgi:post-segregation antitoxin (ccd killing protein)